MKSFKMFLKEDAYDNDVTTALVPECKCVAEIVANQVCILAGAKETGKLFESQELKTVFSRKDGEELREGEVVMKVEGTNKALFPVIRTALNILCRMSGIASDCRKAQDITGKYKVKTAITRKTTPGFRVFEKKAARIGGSWPHRKNLSEMILLKKGHLAYFDSIQNAVKKAKKAGGGKKVEVEATTLEEAVEAARAGADMVMLDNFSVVEAGKALDELRQFKVKVELSGGITFENLEEYARLKPDIISMGCLTNSAQSVDFSMRLTS